MSQRRQHLSRGWRFAAFVAAATLVVPALSAVDAGAASSKGNPAKIGSWTRPFEEGGSKTPRCITGADGRIVCKPVGYAQAALKDGRVFYFNGIESSENEQYLLIPELAPESRNSRSRILDLRSGVPIFSTPSHADGGGTNPNVKKGNPGGLSDLMGMLGDPGRPGDGFVGTYLGQYAPHNPTNPPDEGVANSGDMFCADVVSLADGRLLIAGGTDWYNEPGATDRNHGGPYDVGVIELEGLRTSRIFNADTSDFTATGPMKYGRWYPSMVTLSDGKVFVASGVTKLIKSTQGSQVRRTETFDPATNKWTENYTGAMSENTLPLFPRLHLMPNGKIFYAGTGQSWGPLGQAVDEALWGLQQFFNLQTKQWETVGMAPLGTRSGAFQVMLPLTAPFDKATLLNFGGTLGPTPGTYVAIPASELTTVTKAGKVTNEATGNLHHPRWFSSGVLLPDGQVMALNGGDVDEVIFPGTERPVKTPELYNPKTGTWTDMAVSERDRTYHNSAILLGDGRVLSGGHSPISALFGAHHDLAPQGTGLTANNDKDSSFEIFSPPYLFRGARPSIASAPSGVQWGQAFDITTDGSALDSVVLMRTPSAQHVVDSDPRTLVMPFTQNGKSVHVSAPPNGVVAPPGTYYLFLNKKSPKGVIPSTAAMVTVGSSADAKPAYIFPELGAKGGSATPTEDTSYIAKPPGPPKGQLPPRNVGWLSRRLPLVRM